MSLPSNDSTIRLLLQTKKQPDRSSLSGPGAAGGRRLRDDLVQGDAPDFEQPFDDTSDDIIGRAGPCRDPNRQLSRRKPPMSSHDGSRLRIAIADLVRGDEALFVLNVIGGRVLRAQLRQVAGVR